MAQKSIASTQYGYSFYGAHTLSLARTPSRSLVRQLSRSLTRLLGWVRARSRSFYRPLSLSHIHAIHSRCTHLIQHSIALNAYLSEFACVIFALLLLLLLLVSLLRLLYISLYSFLGQFNILRHCTYAPYTVCIFICFLCFILFCFQSKRHLHICHQMSHFNSSYIIYSIALGLCQHTYVCNLFMYVCMLYVCLSYFGGPFETCTHSYAYFICENNK